MVTILDGAMGTELLARGVSLPEPLWSAAAVRERPDAIASIHADYAAAGATLHTACTFRTKRRQAGEAWDALAREAVAIARRSVPRSHLVVGSVAPLEDCYRPELAPDDARAEHAELAGELARAGVDRLLCETFANVREALEAVDACVATGIPTWLALTAGYDATLLSPRAMADGAIEAARRGAQAVLVSCTPARDTLRFVEAIARAGVPFGASANAGDPADRLGWSDHADVNAYARLAATWIDAGATIVGGCCGTSPRHVAALAARWSA